MTTLNKDIMNKVIFSSVADYIMDAIENPQVIKSKIMQKTVDVFDYAHEDDLSSVTEVTNEIYEASQNEPGVIANVSIVQKNSSQSFHQLVWETLDIKQRTLACMWFLEFIAEKEEKIPVNATIEMESDSPVLYVNDKGSYWLVIGLEELMRDRKEDEDELEEDEGNYGFEILLYLLQANVLDNVSILVGKFNSKQELTEEEVILAANGTYQLVEPEAFDKFIDGEELTAEEEISLMYYMKQPIQMEYRKAFEQTDVYIDDVTESINLDDDAWQEYRLEMLEMYTFVDD